MVAPLRPTVDCEFHHTGLPVSDVSAAMAFYTEKLGFELAFTSGEPVSIAGVNLGKAQIFLEKGAPNPSGCNVYFVVGDADELFEFQRERGVQVVAPPILLHTSDGVGPHTKGTLRFIAQLKERHGIDYDTHGSYRFTERGS